MTKINYNRPMYKKGKEVKVEEGNKPVEMRVYLMVGYNDKDFVKKLGATWDPKHKLWFAFPSHPNIQKMRQWIHKDDYVRCGFIEEKPKTRLKELLANLK